MYLLSSSHRLTILFTLALKQLSESLFTSFLEMRTRFKFLFKFTTKQPYEILIKQVEVRIHIGNIYESTTSNGESIGCTCLYISIHKTNKTHHFKLFNFKNKAMDSVKTLNLNLHPIWKLKFNVLLRFFAQYFSKMICIKLLAI